MFNGPISEIELFEIYVVSAMSLMRLPLEEGQSRVIKDVDLWREMASKFPEGVEPEDFDAFSARAPQYMLRVVQHAGERLAAEDRGEF